MAAPIVVLVDYDTEVHNKERILGRQVRMIDLEIAKAELVIALVVIAADGIGADVGRLAAANGLEVVTSRSAEALADGTSPEVHLVLLEHVTQDAGVLLGIEGGRRWRSERRRSRSHLLK